MHRKTLKVRRHSDSGFVMSIVTSLVFLSHSDSTMDLEDQAEKEFVKPQPAPIPRAEPVVVVCDKVAVDVAEKVLEVPPAEEGGGGGGGRKESVVVDNKVAETVVIGEADTTVGGSKAAGGEASL